MSTRLTCPRGHQWEPNGAPPGLCPVCGDAAQPESSHGTLDLRAAPPHRLLAVPDAPSTLPPHGRPPPPPSPPTGDIPGYELLGELGRGGMGVVYKARQTALKRMVALKMILAGPHAGQQELARFKTEAEAVARLQHPHIVQIYEVGEHDGRPYLTLEYLGGGTLAQRAAGAPQPAFEASRLVETLARTMHFAHQRGVLHRDLKPANVLLGDDGVPKIADFGLAKRLGEEGPTLTDAVVGTPAYMAPEQVTGRSRDLGPATDVYALGAVLYELLTGRPPFRGENKLETLERVRQQDPAAPSRLKTDLPRDLDTICLKCLDKDPRRRYASALDLAEDLWRFQAGEPIRARPTELWESVWKWARRRPAVAGLLAALALMFVTGFAAVTVLWLRAEGAENEATRRAEAEAEASTRAQEERSRAEKERDSADRLRREAEQREARLALDQALALCEQGDADRGLLWLARALDLAVRLEDAGLERAARVNLAEWSTQVSVPGPALPHSGVEVRAVAFSPDGQGAFTAAGNVITRWDLAGRGPRQVPLNDLLGVLAKRAWCVAYSPDGRRAATGRGDGTVRVYDLTTNTPVGPPLHHGKGDVWSVAYSGDGRTLASAGEREARVWDAATGKPAGEPLAHPDAVYAVALSPDGQRVLTGCRDGLARLWDTATGQAVGAPLRHGDGVTAAAFAPDGQVAATGSRDGTARLWDVQTHLPLGEPLRHAEEALSVSFARDGRTLLTGSRDGTARLWCVPTCLPLGPPIRHEGPVSSVALTPDGRRALIGSFDGGVRLWRVAQEQALGPPLAHTRAVHTVAFHPRGGKVLTAGLDAARLWDGETGSQLSVCDNKEWVRCAAFRPDGEGVVTARWFNDLVEWDLSAPHAAEARVRGKPFALEGGASAVVLTPDGRRLLAVGVKSERVVRSWDVEGRRPRPEQLAHDTPVQCLGVSRDGRRLAAGCHDRTVWLWDLATNERVRPPLPHADLVQAVALSPDGRVLASACRDGTVRLWDAEKGEALPAMPQHRGEVLAVAFSPDGRRLFTGSTDRTARVWDAETGLPLGPPLWHRDAVQAVAFSPDGRELLTGCRAHVARRWRAPGGPLGGSAGEARLWAEALTGKELAGDAWRRLDDDAWRERLRELGQPEHAEFLDGTVHLRPLPVVPDAD